MKLAIIGGDNCTFEDLKKNINIVPSNLITNGNYNSAQLANTYKCNLIECKAYDNSNEVSIRENYYRMIDFCDKAIVFQELESDSIYDAINYLKFSGKEYKIIRCIPITYIEDKAISISDIICDPQYSVGIYKEQVESGTYTTNRQVYLNRYDFYDFSNASSIYYDKDEKTLGVNFIKNTHERPIVDDMQSFWFKKSGSYVHSINMSDDLGSGDIGDAFNALIKVLQENHKYQVGITFKGYYFYSDTLKNMYYEREISPMWVI